MKKIEISDKLQAVADSEGLALEELHKLLDGGADIPQPLLEVFGRITDVAGETCADD